MNTREQLIADLESALALEAKDRFTGLFERVCVHLGLGNAEAAEVFDTSVPNVSRWRRGVALPAYKMVMRFSIEELEKDV